MRDIKFRAWVDDSMWNVNGLAQSDGSDAMDLIDHSIGGYDEVHLYDYSKDCILMQYTGLKDCNGKEIYEGDIVEYCECVDEYTVDGPYIGTEVVFEDGIFCLKNDSPNPLSIYVNLKVVGNIYENPELVKP